MDATDLHTTLQSRGIALIAIATGLRAQCARPLTDDERATIRQYKEALLLALSTPAKSDRRCYQCASFQRSPFGLPLGQCRQHGDRIQHATSEPMRFGCGDFILRTPDGKSCACCRNYNPDSTMCRVVNLGCPFPHIPPCHGERFQPMEEETAA